MAEELNVELRESRGTRNARRLRKAGNVPAILYGHGQETVCLSVPGEALDFAVRHGSRLVQLTGAISEQAFIRECQWDTWGAHILHVDFTRVSEHEKVQVQVSLELRGEAPGMKAGGVIKHLVHEIEVECEATAIPEKISVNINLLNLGESVTVGDLELPSGVSVGLEPTTVVVQCAEPVEALEEEAAEEVEAEPEVIGRQEEEGEEKSKS